MAPAGEGTRVRRNAGSDDMTEGASLDILGGVSSSAPHFGYFLRISYTGRASAWGPRRANLHSPEFSSKLGLFNARPIA